MTGVKPPVPATQIRHLPIQPLAPEMAGTLWAQIPLVCSQVIHPVMATIQATVTTWEQIRPAHVQATSRPVKARQKRTDQREDRCFPFVFFSQSQNPKHFHFPSYLRRSKAVTNPTRSGILHMILNRKLRHQTTHSPCPRNEGSVD